jgi:hypothetical protein
MELALYNSVLSGVSLDGTNFFYTNPLRVTDPFPTELRWPHRRVPFLGSFCCPPNLARTIAESPGYAYTKSADAIWVNLYGGSTLKTGLGGQSLELNLETEYPWNGRVRITVNGRGEQPFALKLRIPGWAQHASVRINQRPADSTLKPGTYLEIRRVWTTGDVVDLDLPMPVELIEAHPLVEETLGQVAVKRGPTVYCLESVDLPEGVKPLEVWLAPDTNLHARYDQRLLGGAVVLEGTAVARSHTGWQNQLYRELQPVATTSFNLRLIPYALWANRGPAEMSVWLPLARP